MLLTLQTAAAYIINAITNINYGYSVVGLVTFRIIVL